MHSAPTVSSLVRDVAKRAISFLRTQFPGTPGSPNRKIFRAAIIVGLLTLVGKLGSTAKELIVAGRFGRGDALDAFLIAYLLPAFLLLLVRGVFEPALIPALVQARHNRGATQALFSTMLLFNMLAATVIAVLLGFLASSYLPYLALGFTPAKLQLTRKLLYALLPFVVLSAFTGNASAVLNAGEKFTLPAVAPLTTPLATILLIVVGPRSWGPFLLVGGLVAGSLVEAAWLAWALQVQGMNLKLQWTGLTPEARAVLKQSAPMLAGILFMSCVGVVDQSMAAMLAPGSVSALSYGNRIVSAFTAIGFTALSTGAFPYLAKMVAESDWAGCRHTLKRYSMLVAAATVPITVCLIVFSKPLVRLLYQRGAFTSSDSELVSRVQICYSLQIPFYIGIAVFMRFLSSMRRNDVFMVTSAAALALDIMLNLVLMRMWGVAGIALSTSLVYIVSFMVSALWSFRLLEQQRLRVQLDPSGDSQATAGAVGSSNSYD